MIAVTKSERRWLKVLTVLVVVFVIMAMIPVAVILGRNIHNDLSSSRRDEEQRNVFADCAYIAQAHMNCYDDGRQIVDYAKVVNWYDALVGYCFFFDEGGYALVTSYDYALAKFSLDEDTPFPEEYVPESELYDIMYVYSLQPTTFVMPDDGDESTPRQYRTFDAGTCFCVKESNWLTYCFDDQAFSLEGNSFDGRYVVYPGAGSSAQNDAEYVMKFAEPDGVLRGRMLEVAKKQLIETGHDSEEYKNEIYSLAEQLADEKSTSGMLRHMLG